MNKDKIIDEKWPLLFGLLEEINNTSYSVMERLTKDSSDGDDPMMQNLPIVTSCTFYSYGTAGKQENICTGQQ